MLESSTSNTAPSDVVSDFELWLIIKELKACKNIYDEQNLLAISQTLDISFEKVSFVAELFEEALMKKFPM